MLKAVAVLAFALGVSALVPSKLFVPFQDEAINCANDQLLPVPEDPSLPGPWPVGAMTLNDVTSRKLTIEVWYPARVGSDAGVKNEIYDIRKFLPKRYQNSIPDSEGAVQPCECFRDLPMDVSHGPYPVVLFVHGTAGFRTQSLHQMTHLASRGFLVVSADHPGINLKDILTLIGSPSTDQLGDAKKILDELKLMDQNAGKFAFLRGIADLSRIAASGHSAGGNAVSGLGDLVDVIVPISAGSAKAGSRVKSYMLLSGMQDGIAAYSGVKSAYNKLSFAPKFLVGVGLGAGHLAPSDLCWIGRDNGGIVAIAKRNGIVEAYLLGALGTDGCKEGSLKDEEAWPVFNYALAAIFEETLKCNPRSRSSLESIQQRFNRGQIGEFAESL